MYAYIYLHSIHYNFMLILLLPAKLILYVQYVFIQYMYYYVLCTAQLEHTTGRDMISPLSPPRFWRVYKRKSL